MLISIRRKTYAVLPLQKIFFADILDLLIIITDLTRIKHTSFFQENEGCNIILKLKIKIIHHQKEYSFFTNKFQRNW